MCPLNVEWKPLVVILLEAIGIALEVMVVCIMVFRPSSLLWSTLLNEIDGH